MRRLIMVVKQFPKKNIITRWFKENSPWCPLFGVIPFKFLGDDSSVKQPIKIRCLTIIDEARYELWDVRHPLDMAPFSYSWPKPEEVSWYPSKDLLIGRGIYLDAPDIFRAARVRYADRDPYMPRGYEAECMLLTHGALQKPYKGPEDIEDYKKLGIFSIYLAWHCLKEVLSGEEKADDPGIWKDLLLAEAFLKEAENIQRVRLKDRAKKTGQKGGWMHGKILAVTLAIGRVDQPPGKKSALALWQCLKHKYRGEEHFMTKESDIFFETKGDEIENLMTVRTFKASGKTRKIEIMKDQRITFSAFRTYVKAYRKKIAK
jgi:hypothetical protein